jgi:hypothetical protein
VAFFAHDNEAFSDCAGFPYDFSLNDLRTFSVVSKGPLVPQVCCKILLKSLIFEQSLNFTALIFLIIIHG